MLVGSIKIIGSSR